MNQPSSPALNDKPRLIISSGHNEALRQVTLSQDGRYALTVSADKTAKLWEVASWSELWSRPGNEMQVKSATFSPLFSPEKPHVLLCPPGGHAFLWNTRADELVCKMSSYCAGEAAFSPDNHLVLGANRGEAVLWNAETGAEVRRFRHPEATVISAFAFSRDGDVILTGSVEGTVQAWRADTGDPLGPLFHHGGQIWAITTLADRQAVLTADQDGVVLRWQIHGGKILDRWETSECIHAIHVTADDQTALFLHSSRLSLWDMAEGKESRFFEQSYQMSGMSVIASAFRDAALAPDGHVVFADHYENHVVEWRPDAQPALSSPELLVLPTARAEFAPDGRSIRVVRGPSIVAWDASTGAPRELPEPAADAADWRLSPYGRLKVVSSPQLNETRWWDASVYNTETQTEVSKLLDVYSELVHASFSKDGLTLLTNRGFYGMSNGLVQRWDLSTGKLLRSYNIQALTVGHSPDGRFFVTASLDGITRVWNVETGALVCRLVSFKDKTWAVVDPEGRYDASNAGDIKGLYWVVGFERIALSQLKQRYYEPHLLSKLLGFNHEELRNVDSFTAPKLFPGVAPFRVEGDTLRLTLTDRGGGFGPVRVAVNQSEAFEICLVDPEPRDGVAQLLVNGKAAEGDISGELTLKGHLLMLVIKSARFEASGAVVSVTAFNQEGYLSSRRVIADDAPDPDAVAAGAEPPASKLHAIVVGVSRYADDGLQLTYAAKDARAFADALRLAAPPLFRGEENVSIQVLTSNESGYAGTPTTAPTREAIDRAFTDVAAKAGENDVLVVFLAGHGCTFKGEFLYLTSAARKDTCCSPDRGARDLAAISDGALFEHLRDIKANKRVMILDACESGAMLDNQSSSRGTLSTAQALALERLNDRMGFFLLAGAPANAASLEAKRYEQGLLTYSLLEGMKKMELRDGVFVDVANLLNYAADRVPRLASDIGGVQRPVVSMSQVATRAGAGAPSPSSAGRSVTGSFDVGRLEQAKRTEIKYKEQASPSVVRSSFQDGDEVFDVLGLGELVDDLLRGKEPAIELKNQSRCAGAYGLSGNYVCKGSDVEVRVRVLHDGQKSGDIVLVKGTKEDPAKLAQALVDALFTALRVPAA
jgi:WD40 repeat protein/uncharacterized caspase-like protein